MKVSAETIEDCQVVLNIELDPEEIEQSLEKAYRRLVGRASVPGFRRGKAPRPMLERYLGRAALLQEALDHLLPEVYDQAIQEQAIDAIAQPQIEVVQMDPVVFRATVPVRPIVELGSYRDIRLVPEAVEVAETEVDNALEQLRSLYAPWEPVERAVHFGDLLTLDLQGSIDGKPSLNEKGLQYHLLPDSPLPVPGFAQRLEGLEKGNEKEFSISFPSDHEVAGLAGKEYSFQVTVTEVKEQRLPELDDEFAKGVDQGFENLDLLRQRVASNLKAWAEAEARERFEEKVVEAVVEQAHVEFPSILVESEIDRLIEERRERLRRSRVRLEEYLKDVKKTEEELKEELRPLARERVVRSLVLGKVAEVEKIAVSAEEVDSEVERMAQAGGDKAEETHKFFDSSAARESLERLLLTRRIVERLVQIATGGDVTETESEEESALEHRE